MSGILRQNFENIAKKIYFTNIVLADIFAVK